VQERGGTIDVPRDMRERVAVLGEHDDGFGDSSQQTGKYGQLGLAPRCGFRPSRERRQQAPLHGAIPKRDRRGPWRREIALVRFKGQNELRGFVRIVMVSRPLAFEGRQAARDGQP
jgi:hypothetical protein